VAQILARAGGRGTAVNDIAREAAMNPGYVAEILSRMRDRGEVLESQNRWLAASAVGSARAAVLEALRGYHRARPWRRGMPRAEWLALVRRQVGEELARLVAESVEHDAGFVRAPGHVPSVTPEQERLLAVVGDRIRKSGNEAPGRAALVREFGPGCESVLQMMLDNAEAVELRGMVFATAVVNRAAQRIAEHVRLHGTLSVGQARDLLGGSRKYLMALLEHFDTIGITRRRGEVRIAGPELARQEVERSASLAHNPRKGDDGEE
jgi:selenocysteine-specific elongation factor